MLSIHETLKRLCDRPTRLEILCLLAAHGPMRTTEIARRTGLTHERVQVEVQGVQGLGAVEALLDTPGGHTRGVRWGIDQSAPAGRLLMSLAKFIAIHQQTRDWRDARDA